MDLTELIVPAIIIFVIVSFIAEKIMEATDRNIFLLGYFFMYGWGILASLLWVLYMVWN